MWPDPIPPCRSETAESGATISNTVFIIDLDGASQFAEALEALELAGEHENITGTWRVTLEFYITS